MGMVGALQLWNGPAAFHHCYCDQNAAPARDNEISQHPLPGGQALRFCWDDHTGRIVMEMKKSTDKIQNHGFLKYLVDSHVTEPGSLLPNR